MTRTDHLLTILAEECAEVAQRVSKALRFGLAEVEPGQPFTNAQRVIQEHMDLLAVMKLLFREGSIDPPTPQYLDKSIAAKIKKVEKFLAYSAECGTLSEPRP